MYLYNFKCILKCERRMDICLVLCDLCMHNYICTLHKYVNSDKLLRIKTHIKITIQQQYYNKLTKT